jgi:hypothetical protein
MTFIEIEGVIINFDNVRSIRKETKPLNNRIYVYYVDGDHQREFCYKTSEDCNKVYSKIKEVCKCVSID